MSCRLIWLVEIRTRNLRFRVLTPLISDLWNERSCRTFQQFHKQFQLLATNRGSKFKIPSKYSRSFDMNFIKKISFFEKFCFPSKTLFQFWNILSLPLSRTFNSLKKYFVQQNSDFEISGLAISGKFAMSKLYLPWSGNSSKREGPYNVRCGVVWQETWESIHKSWCKY